MRKTDIELDEKLVNEAMKLTRKTTRSEVINFTLEELVRKLKRKKLLALKGKVGWAGNLCEMRKSRTAVQHDR